MCSLNLCVVIDTTSDGVILVAKWLMILLFEWNLSRAACRKASPSMSAESSGTVDFRLQPSDRPATDDELCVLRDLWDEKIDNFDTQLQTATEWRPVADLIPAENKQQITLRLDADLIAFFRATGRRYQSRMNAALREYVNSQKRGE